MKTAKTEYEAQFLAIPDWQRRILDERNADLERNPGGEQTWDEVKAEILSEEEVISAEPES